MRTPAGGAEYLATHSTRCARQNPNTLVVGAGDIIGASPLVSALFHDEPTIEAMNAMGLDISSVGNHEFDEGSAELLRMQYGGCHPVDGCQDGDGFAGAGFDYLAANVVDDDTGGTLFPPTRSAESGAEGRLHRHDARGHADDGHAVGRRGADVPRRGRHDQRVHGPSSSSRAWGRSWCCSTRVAVGRAASTTARPGRPAGRHHRALDQAVDVVVTGHTHQAYICEIDGKLVTSAASFGRLMTDIDLRIDQRPARSPRAAAT